MGDTRRFYWITVGTLGWMTLSSSIVGCDARPTSNNVPPGVQQDSSPQFSGQGASGRSGGGVEDKSYAKTLQKDLIGRAEPQGARTGNSRTGNSRTRNSEVGNSEEQARGDAERRIGRRYSGPPPIDPMQLEAAGIRRVAGKHLTLYTDLPRQPAIDELPRVFDLAVPQWCEFFAVEGQRVADWHMTAYLIGDKNLFRRVRVLRAGLPPFLNGYQMGFEIWCYKQPSDYYRRHLLLHEGTHGFMNHWLGGAGPPWYMEGSAELLATHSWLDGSLTLKAFPRDRRESSHWGRIKAIKDELLADRGMSLQEIMRYTDRDHMTVEPYAWCWAASAFFEQHPLTRTSFAGLRNEAGDRSHAFSRRFREGLQDDWPILTHQWQMFVRNLDYGYELQRELFVSKSARPIGRDETQLTVAADRGWQSTGLELAAGSTVSLEAWGRYQIATEPETWWCEPNGVTIRYYNGLPLGILLATVLDETTPAAHSPLVSPTPIGLSQEILVESNGILYLRINEDPAQHHDNWGELAVTVRLVTK